MQVYRGMDIGTAKPSAEDRASVPHHLLDLAQPDEDFSVARFQAAARAVLADLNRREARALLVGGTGLYLRAVLDDLELPGQWREVRAELEVEASTSVLHDRLRALDPEAAARMEPTNRRRVVRALEVTLGSGRPFSSFGPGLEAYPPARAAQLGLAVPLDELDARITDRVQIMMADGWLEEVRTLSARPGGLSPTAAQALGYRELLAHLRGECSEEEAVAETIRRTRRFARRQLRWFRRDPRIQWVDVDANPLAAASRLLGDCASCA